MTRKDYELLADALRVTKPKDSVALDQWCKVCDAIANALHRDNSRFSYVRFYLACGRED